MAGMLNGVMFSMTEEKNHTATHIPATDYYY